MTETPTAQPLGAGSQTTRLIPPVGERDHAQGPATAAVTLVEYGDYYDQQCAAALPQIEALRSRMGDRLRFVFRHFPASGLYLHAAEAAEAAGLQGQFWEMHEALFEHQSELGNGHLVEYARDLGLDMIRFLRDLAGDVSTGRVRSDLAGGARSGVQNTPTFFVNGVRQLDVWNVGLASTAALSAQNVEEVGRWADDGAPPALDGGSGESDVKEGNEEERDGGSHVA